MKWTEQSLTKGSLDKLYLSQVLPLYKDQPDYAFLNKTEVDKRIFFYIRKLIVQQGLTDTNKHIVDLGAGFSYFGVLLRRLGFEVTIIDDFRGGGEFEKDHDPKTTGMIERFRSIGIRVVEQDLLTKPLPILDQSVDAITTFHCIEHWHHSPRPLFDEIRRVLRVHGLLVIGCPNPVNLRKRISVLLGKSNLCSLEEWYYSGDPVFRGHVREPIVEDLIQLAHWNGFRVRHIAGENFLAQNSRQCSLHASGLRRSVYQTVLSVVDPVLRMRPNLCSDIHIVAEKENRNTLQTTKTSTIITVKSKDPERELTTIGK